MIRVFGDGRARICCDRCGRPIARAEQANIEWCWGVGGQASVPARITHKPPYCAAEDFEIDILTAEASWLMTIVPEARWPAFQ